MSHSEATKAPLETTSEDWDKLPWRKLERHCYRLQKRIYRAAERGNVQAIHRLQQLVMRSRSARLVAVRRVTQDNQGKKTAGIDGIKSLTPPQRLALVEAIHPKHQERRKARPVRRVWIPKPGKAEQRPLGIPTLYDRACQALAKQALEPEWEARFEPHSYGFRPGRCQHDAIEAIFHGICHHAKWVLDADIAGCFEHLRQEILVKKLATYPTLRRRISAWLKAGVMEAGHFTPTPEGVPQGGVLSPLLMNVALHGLETTLAAAFTRREGKPLLVRYADDLVVLHPNRDGVHKARQVVEDWLLDLGLTLKPEKTRIRHTLEGPPGQVGFDFLGMTIRQHPVGKTHSGTGNDGNPLGFKTLITPSRTAIKAHLTELGKVVRDYQAAPQEGLIAHLNPVITGWANYHRTVVAKEIFSRCDHQLYNMLRHWTRRRHPRKNAHWVVHKYWAVDQGEGWRFKAPDGSTLTWHAATSIKRFVQVRGTASPYDGKLLYWAQRLKEHPLVNSRVGYLLKLQQGRCAYCGLYLKDADLLELDHIIPQRLGGDDRLMNLQLLHRHCHDQKTATLDAKLAHEMASVSMTRTL